MTPRIVFRSLAWTEASTPSSQRLPALSFRASWEDTLDLLAYEAEKLGATEITIEAGFREGDVRRDGQPRKDALEPAHPGVVVSFVSKHGPLRYSTDAFPRWRHNVRAIALALQALRRVDRYGVSKRGEQYAGWAALPPGSADGDGQERPRFRSAEEAARWMVVAAGHAEKANDDGLIQWVIRNEFGIREQAYREAAKRMHPDSGGTTEGFQRLQEARELLDAASR